MINRSSGILLPIFSLPSKYGIGTFGASAYKFVDFLKEAGVKYWQILPIHPITYGNSPYQSTSTYAGMIYYIDLELLTKEKLLKESDYKNVDFGDDLHRVDYDKIIKNKRPILLKAANNFIASNTDKADYEKFKCDFSYFLYDYATFSVIKDRYSGIPYNKWDRIHRLHYDEVISEFNIQNVDDIEIYIVLQYFFYKQWFELKKYANDKNIKIIGDMPIYSSLDSVEVFVDYKNFLLDDDRRPKLVAGCPPDIFCEDGQLWHNPLYDYDYMKKDNYNYFVRRMKHLSLLYDVIRIDHFRGFANYYGIDANETTAKNGKWYMGPGIDLFNEVHKNVDNLEIIAEDLGYIDEPVYKLLEETKYPGMRVVEFAFSGDIENNQYLPKNFIENSVAYLGTHDNDTFIGWIEKLDEGTREQVKKYLHIDDADLKILENDVDSNIAPKEKSGNEKITKKSSYSKEKILGARKNVVRTAIRELYDSKANLVVLLMQDLLSLTGEARINAPATVGNFNWSYKFTDDYINGDTKEFLLEIINKTNR